MATELPTYVTLDEAARKHLASPEMLTKPVENGRIEAARTPREEVMVADDDVRVAAEHSAKRQELWERVRHLDGTPIGIEEGSRTYRFGVASLYNWVELGHVRVMSNRRARGRWQKRLLNEADVAYAALGAEVRGRRPGRPILTPEFAPTTRLRKRVVQQAPDQHGREPSSIGDF